MSATGTRGTAQSEVEAGVEEQPAEGLQVVEAATKVEIDREEIVEGPPGETVEQPVEASEAFALTPALSQEERECDAQARLGLATVAAGNRMIGSGWRCFLRSARG